MVLIDAPNMDAKIRGLVAKESGASVDVPKVFRDELPPDEDVVAFNLYPGDRWVFAQIGESFLKHCFIRSGQSDIGIERMGHGAWRMA